MLIRCLINTSSCIFFTLILLSTFFSVGQALLGISESNYAGINGVYNNPANLADNRLSVGLHVATFDTYITNDYLTFDAPYSLFSFITNTASPELKSVRNKTIFKPEYLTFDESKEKANILVNSQFRGPSILFTINDKSAVALSSRLRAYGNMNNVDRKIAGILTYGTNRAGLRGPTETVTDITSNVNFFMDISGTYSRVLLENDEHFIKGGIGMKYLAGYYSNYMKIDDATYTITPDSPNSVRDNITTFTLNGSFSNVDENSFKQFNLSPSWLLGEGALGTGLGFDIGIVYEHRSDYKKYSYREKGKRKLNPSKNKYDFKIGFSILDIGSIRYNSPPLTSQFPINTSNTVLSYRDFGKIKGTNDLKERVERILGPSSSSTKSDFTVRLPTNFHLNFDYKLSENIYLNAVWQQSLVKRSSLGVATTSFVAIAPRYESKWLEVSLPISYEENLNIGTGIRLGPVFVGSDNIIGFFDLGHKKTFDLYMGAYIPIYRKGPKIPNACWSEPTSGGFLKKLFHKK
ncbi:MAG: hypothetical protein KA327_07135 [Pseudarcicella sp.]|nr:hypothetical protein [Pseudarcicella sp.]